ncbi:hypothetical protein ACFSR7_21535 [Cohnella sp. GCM10020058]|uniref:BclA C-terminal domain-containing protein n=1 Tax=Cohnella sp. GCM10020058 TaxID=3317330 RepID=UPI00363817B5
MTSNYAFAANTTGTGVLVVLGGTSVPLPSSQNIGAGISINGANTIFTVASSGTYYITYQINLSSALLISARLIINGTANVPSNISTGLSTTMFNNVIVVTLAAGSTITLQLYGLVATATLISGGAGAAVTIIRLV